MSNIQTDAERMPHDLSHLGFLAGQIGRLITISTTPVIASDYFELDSVGALRLPPLRLGRAIDSAVDMFTFYVRHRHVYVEQWIKFMIFSGKSRHTRSLCDWSSDVCSSDLREWRSRATQGGSFGCEGSFGCKEPPRRRSRGVGPGPDTRRRASRRLSVPADPRRRGLRAGQIGRASCRERV